MPPLIVTWDLNHTNPDLNNENLSEGGFADDDQARRFIDKICKQVAPEKTYFVLTPIPPS